MGIEWPKRRFTVLAALTAVVLIGSPVANAAASSTFSPRGAMQPSSIKCDETPPDCSPEVCFCPVW
jgi:hypothetical protein